DEKHGEHKMIAYRFAENAQLANDPDDVRFNFSPCFVTIGKHFVASSTIELCHELIDLLEKETKQEPVRETPAAMRTRLYSAGSADSLEIGKDALLSQTILGRAVTIDEARAETKALIELVRRLGLLRIETNYTTNDFRVDVHWQLTK